MNPTSQNPGTKFPFISGHNPMDDRTLYLTLVASACLSFAVILIFYAAVFGRNPANRVGFGLLVSVPPALGTLLVAKLTKAFESWLGAFLVYLALLVLAVIIQAFGRNFGA
jgi:hypothetical protein